MLWKSRAPGPLTQKLFRSAKQISMKPHTILNPQLIKQKFKETQFLYVLLLVIVIIFFRLKKNMEEKLELDPYTGLFGTRPLHRGNYTSRFLFRRNLGRTPTHLPICRTSLIRNGPPNGMG